MANIGKNSTTLTPKAHSAQRQRKRRVGASIKPPPCPKPQRTASRVTGTNATSGANNTANNSPNGAGVGNRHIASSKASAP